MALSRQTLVDGLTNLALTDNQADANSALADVFKTYLREAVFAAPNTPVTPSGAPYAAIDTACAAISANAANGTAQIAAAFANFWSAAVAAPAALVAGATVLTSPPGVASLAATLAALPVTTVQLATQADAAEVFANAIHPANAGATATIPGTPPVILTVVQSA